MSRVLIIDDDTAARGMVRSRLADVGHDVVEAGDADDGIDRALRGGHDVIVLAYSFPGPRTGLDICRELVSRPELASTPIVVYSTAPEAGDNLKAYDAGCAGFVDTSEASLLPRVVDVVLRSRSRTESIRERQRTLRLENRRLQHEAAQPSADGVDVEDGTKASAVPHAAGFPDAALLVDGGGVIRTADVGSAALFGKGIEGRELSTVVPTSGLATFVREARQAPRAGFRFDLPGRSGQPGRALTASVYPAAAGPAGADAGMRVVLLIDVDKRRVAEEVLRATEPDIPRRQVAPLYDAARRLYGIDALPGRSAPITLLRRGILQRADDRVPVVVRGEAGTPVAVVARAVHYAGERPGPLDELRISALSRPSIERQLFGFVRGAFPGAITDRPGLLERARGGAALLDGIGDLPADLQERLYEVITSGQSRRLGSDEDREVDVRFLFGTSCDLTALSRDGRFLPKLARLLAPATLEIPPLRDRLNDLPHLVRRHLDGVGAVHGCRGISNAAMLVLSDYDWPGNDEELAACMEKACQVAAGETIQVKHLAAPLREMRPDLTADDLIPARPTDESADAPESNHVGRARAKEWEVTADDPISFEVYERKALLRALDNCNGDKMAAARLLQVGKSTLYRKLRRFGIR